MKDKLALICGYPIDKVVEIVDGYKQGKLIPVSWLEEKAEQYQKAYEAEVEQNGYDASRYYLDMYNAIYTLIDEWENEYGKSQE